MKKRFLSEKNLVVVLFVMVLVIFSFAQEDTKKMERMFLNTTSPTTSLDQASNQDANTKKDSDKNIIPATHLR